MPTSSSCDHDLLMHCGGQRERKQGGKSETMVGERKNKIKNKINI